MGEHLWELEQSLRSRKVTLTPEEDSFLLRCKSKALREFVAGSLAGGGVTAAATWKSNKLLRANLAFGAATVFGFWRFNRSLYSCVEHILSQDQTRLQIELAKIILKKYQNDPWSMQLVSKHFYSEEIYDDSTTGPKLRWRYRNFYSDNVSHDQKTQEKNLQNDSHGNDHKESPTVPHTDSHSDYVSKRTDIRSKQVPVNSGTDLMADPLDCIFGHATIEEVHQTDTSTLPSKTLSRAQKRSHRRRRMRRHHKGAVDSRNE